MNESDLIVRNISRLNKSKVRRFIHRLDRIQILFLTILLVLLALGVTATFNGKRYVEINFLGAVWIFSAVILMLWAFAVKKDIEDGKGKKNSTPRQIGVLLFYINKFQRTNPPLFPMGFVSVRPSINRTTLNGKPWLDVFQAQIRRSSGHTIDYILKLDPFDGSIEYSEETYSGFPDEPTGTFFITVPNQHDQRYDRDKKGRLRASFAGDVASFARKYPYEGKGGFNQ